MLVTHEYKVEGPSAILLTTTAIELDEELLNRCVVLAVDESREQTQAIHRLQREAQTLEGLERRFAKQDTMKLQQNAQRLLQPLYVVNPYGPRLTFLNETTRRRRDHEKYLGLIEALALLHQHQRQVRTGVIRGRRVDYVEATLSDIATANRLASEALGQTLDELPPQTRRLLLQLEQKVSAECERLDVGRSAYRFTRREVREWTGCGLTQLRLHLERLVEMEYLLTHRGSRGSSFVYELLYEGQGKDGRPFVLGLVDVERLRGTTAQCLSYDSDLAGSGADEAAPKRGRNGGVTVGWRGRLNEADKEEETDSEGLDSRKTSKGSLPKGSSYPSEEPRSSSYSQGPDSGDPGNTGGQEDPEHQGDSDDLPAAVALKVVGGGE
jgi:hypothetical protein